MKRWIPYLCISFTVAFPGASPALARDASTDPARDLARVRLFVSTRAAAVDVTVTNAWVASYRSAMVSGPAAARSSQTGQTLRLSRNVPGGLAEAQFDVILSDVPKAGRIGWTVATDGEALTELELYTATDTARPRAIDRFTAPDGTGTFSTNAALLEPGLIRVAPPPVRLVLAHFYPWYRLETWQSPELSGHPLRPYSTDDQANVTRLAHEARSAGIDAFAVSWNGPDDRRLRVVLDAARNAGMLACAYLEPFGGSPQRATEWLRHLTDTYADHPAYLRVQGRPVILVYTASQLSAEQWSSVLADVRTGGRNPLIVGDFFHSPLLEVLDGEYQYINVMQQPEDLLEINRVETLRVRTYSLLKTGDRRRLWIASVSPGYDDSHIATRPAHTVVPRSLALYDRMWAAAIDTAADWVVITSWNEWYENTGIEPDERDGTRFLDRTRYWARTFKGGP